MTHRVNLCSLMLVSKERNGSVALKNIFFTLLQYSFINIDQAKKNLFHHISFSIICMCLLCLREYMISTGH